MNNQKPIRILHLEDNSYDAQLIEREIRKSELHFELKNVANKADFRLHLKKFKPDIILSDHTLKDFNSIDAFELVKAKTPFIPFILLTGTTSEEFAVERIKKGVDDYILKSSVLRLPEAIKNSMKKKKDEFEKISNQKKLKQEKEFIKLLLDNARFPVLVLDRHGLVKVFNKACQRLTGYNSTEIIYKPVWEKLLPLDQVESSKRFFGQGQDSILKYDFVNQWITKSGKPILIQWSNSFLYNKNGRMSSMLGVGKDITELYKLKKEKEDLASQLIQAQKMEILGTMTGGLAHDYNNILAALLGNLSLLEPLLTKGTRELKLVNRIETSTTRLAGLNQQLLQFTRKSQQEVKVINLNTILEETFNIVIKTIDKRIRLIKQFQPGLPDIIGDENQIMQLFLNIIMNSVDAIIETFTANSNGTITIQTAKIMLEEEKAMMDWQGANLEKELIKVTISDTGTGIPETIQQNIFQPFFTTKRAGKGTGLGLSIAESVIKKHNGIILFDTEPGIGTTFYIYFPFKKTIKDQAISETPKRFGGNLSKAEIPPKKPRFFKILIVDDEDNILEFFGDILKGLGHTPVPVLSGQEAIRIYKKEFNKIDLVIVDLNLPDMNGLQIWEELKIINSEVKIVIFSGALVKEDIEGYMRKGATAVLLKPLSLEKLKEVLGKVEGRN